MGSCCLVGAEFQFCKMKNVLKIEGDDGYATWLYMQKYLMLLNRTLEKGSNDKFYIMLILPQ